MIALCGARACRSRRGCRGRGRAARRRGDGGRRGQHREHDQHRHRATSSGAKLTVGSCRGKTRRGATPPATTRCPRTPGAVRIFMTPALFAEAEESLGLADRERAPLPRRARRRGHARRAPRLRRARGLRDGHQRHAGHGPRRLRHRLRDRRPALRRSPRDAATPGPREGLLAARHAARGPGRGREGPAGLEGALRGDRARRRRGPGRAARRARSATASPSRTPGTSRRTRGPGAGSSSSAAWAAATTSSSCSTTASASG